MAKTTMIGTKVDSETHEKLTHLAAGRQISVSELVREFIETGVNMNEKTAERDTFEQLSKRLDVIEKLAFKTTRAAAKAQFLASMSVGFASDLAKLTVSGQMPSSREKTEFLAQTNEWAEGFASTYLDQD